MIIVTNSYKTIPKTFVSYNVCYVHGGNISFLYCFFPDSLSISFTS